ERVAPTRQRDERKSDSNQSWTDDPRDSPVCVHGSIHAEGLAQAAEAATWTRDQLVTELSDAANLLSQENEGRPPTAIRSGETYSLNEPIRKQTPERLVGGVKHAGKCSSASGGPVASRGET